MILLDNCALIFDALTPERLSPIALQAIDFRHHDPADRIIAATALYHHGRLVTCDERLQAVDGLVIVW